ncbi:MAG TPA: hypothetical protein ENK02_00640 [Planctomycetes bacterium]|nr:hypothetical protein [Planctomycetota bacterium]
MKLEEIQKAFRDAVLGREVSIEAAQVLPGKPSIELYRQLILGAASGQLSFAFEEALDGLVEGEELDLDTLLLEMLRENAPRTQSSRELAERFLSWILAYRPNLFEGKEGLRGRMERLLLELQCFYSQDGEGRVLAPAELQSLGGTVEDLLASSLEKAPWLRFWKDEDQALLCSRDEEGLPFWREVDADQWILMQCLEEERPMRIEDLAESWLKERGMEEESEEEAFLAFLRGLLALADARGLMAPASQKP